jgi:hypothetical protein
VTTPVDDPTARPSADPEARHPEDPPGRHLEEPKALSLEESGPRSSEELEARALEELEARSLEALADQQAGVAGELPRAGETAAGQGHGLAARAPAGHSVGARLGELLEPVFADEPPLGDAVDAVFRRAERLRRRRSRAVFAAGVVVVLLVFLAGYVMTTILLPTEPDHSATIDTTVVVPGPDPVLAILAPALSPSRLRVVARDPGAGAGWRQYLVLNANGRPHGLIEVSAYTTPNGLCFPVLADERACARPERALANIDYVRYAFDQDVDWQVNQVIARRLPDGRTIVVQATGERGTGTATGGRPPLSALLAARIATNPRLAVAFGPTESCNSPDAACPVLKVPVPIAGG